MALLPIHARERDALGLFKAHSADYSASSEGGLVVELVEETNDLVVANYSGPGDGSGDATAKNKYALLDEQATSTKETMLGKFLPANKTPVVLGPATFLGSNHVSVWLESGWFLTDNYTLAVDGYGEATMANNTMLLVDATGKLGAAGDPSRVYFMKMIDDLDDLLATRVTPAPTTGLFAEKAPILIYQA
jgi:hypothetical protein